MEFKENCVIRTIYAHKDCILCLILLKKGYLCSGGADISIRILDWQGGNLINELKGHTSWVKCLCKFNDEFLLSGSEDRIIKIWKNNECIKTLEAHTHSIRTLCIISYILFAS